MSIFPAEYLDLVFKKIEWHSGIEYAQMHRISLYPIFHFIIDKRKIAFKYEEKECIITAVSIEKLSHFFYKLDITHFINNNQEEYELISEYFHCQLANLFLDRSMIHFGFEVTHFRFKQDCIWLVFTKTPDPNGVDYEIYKEYEVAVTDTLQKKQILALRNLLESCLVKDAELVNDTLGNECDKPLDINQAYCLTLKEHSYLSNHKRHSVIYGPEVPLPTNSDFKVIGEIITYLSCLIHDSIEIYNTYLID
jgi:hypothetical protein